MNERPHKPIVALTLALCALAVAAPTVSGRPATSRPATGTHSSSTAPPLGGVNIAGLYSGAAPASVDREIATAHSLHAQLVRAEIPWSVLEPSGPNQIDPRALAYTDRLVSDATADGIRVIMTVDSTPCWASSAPTSLLRRCMPGESTSRANAWPPGNPSNYAAFVGYLAARYGTQLAAIEVWNEPDHINQAYFAGPSKAQHYAAILRAAYPAVKRANPNVQVLAGSLVGSNGVFLRALYAAGIKGYYDGLAVHFYSLTLGALRAIHEVQLANGDATPLWLDEFGWSSCWPQARIQQEQACVTPQTQAADIADIFRSLARTPFIAAEVLYELQDSAAGDFGVTSIKGVRKPAFATLAQVLSSPFGSAAGVTLSLRSNGGRVLASGWGPVGDFMELEAFQANVLRYRALFTLNRFNSYSIALPRALGSSGLQVRVYQDWAGASAATQRGI
jgi:Cellulase (glycosyl hydrolase family 5)